MSTTPTASCQRSMLRSAFATRSWVGGSLRQAAVGGRVDLVFLDGWKDLYLPVLELLTPSLKPGSVVAAERGGGDFV
jgi:predicted O-methyltransferase YrrM